MNSEGQTVPLLITENLNKTYGTIQALSDANISLKPGIWGLVGPNGAGKTTLLNLIWGLIYPTSGTIKVLGLNPTEDNLHLKKKLGVCFTSQQMPKGYVSKEYLVLVAKAYNISSTLINPLIYSLSRALELDPALDRDVRHLSSGMKQKLAIIQCLIGLPSLALLDEPFANLDPHTKLYVRDLIIQYNKILGSSFIVSSHSLGDLASFCTHYLFIDHGRILWKGSSTEIPKNELLDFYIKITERDDHRI